MATEPQPWHERGSHRVEFGGGGSVGYIDLYHGKILISVTQVVQAEERDDATRAPTDTS